MGQNVWALFGFAFLALVGLGLLKNRPFGLKIILHTTLKSFMCDFEPLLSFGPGRACLQIRFGLFRRLAYVVQA